MRDVIEIEISTRVDEIAQPLYDAGEFGRLGEELGKIKPANRDERAAWFYWAASQLWRQGREFYAEAFEYAEQAIRLGDWRGWRWVAYYHAVVSKDDQLLQEAISHLSLNDKVASNAIMLRLMDESCSLGPEEIIKRAQCTPNDTEQCSNRLQNAALGLAKKGRGFDDWRKGIEFANRAIEGYSRGLGIDHHRMGAYYRRSLLQEKLGNFKGALESMRLAIHYGLAAQAKDCQNDSYTEKIANNRKRAEELAGKIIWHDF